MKATKSPWISTIIITLAGAIGAACMNKPMAVLPTMMGDLGITMADSGLLVSIFSLAGLLLALPAGLVIQKINAKNTALLAMGILALGCLAGAIAPNFTVVLLSRFIEGVGFSLIAVATPAIVSGLFPPEKMGLPMGVMASYMTIGAFVILNVSPLMVTGNNWQITWWLTLIMALVGAAAVFTLVQEGDAPPPPQGETPPTVKEALKSKSLWYLALAYLFYDIVVITGMSYFPIYLQDVGLSPQEANLYASLPGLIGIVGGMAYGKIADKTGKKKPLLIFGMAVFALFYGGVFAISNTGLMTAVLLASGFFVLGFPSIVMASAPETMPSPTLVGIAMAVIMFAQNLGGFIGPMVYSTVQESFGWTTMGMAMFPVGLIAVFFAVKVKIK